MSKELKVELHPKETEETFYVQCNVCKQVLKDWVGSTPCCGSIAYACNKNGNKQGKKVHLYGKIEQP